LDLRERINLPTAFDRDLRFLMYSMSSRRIAMGFQFVVRSIYFSLLGLSPTLVGLLLSLATLVAAIRQITFGMLSDRFGRKTFILIGAICSTLRLVIFAISPDFWMLALGQIVGAFGEGSGAGQPVVSGYITDKTSELDRSDIFTTLGVSNALATTVGFSMTGLPAFFENRFGLGTVQAHAWLWWIGAIFTAISFLFIIPLKDIKPVKRDLEVETPIERGFMGISSWKEIGKFSLVRSTSGLGWGLIGSLMPLYFFIKFGVGSEFLGPVYAVTRLFTVFSYMLLPWAVEQLGEIGCIMWTRIISAVLAALLTFINWYPLALGLLFFYRIIIHFSMPVRQSFAASLVSPEETATAVGVSNFSRMTLRTTAPTAAGYMFDAISLSLPFISGAILVGINAFLYQIFFKSYDLEEEIEIEE
jgi:predicted MFS family arabinose efflux permease